MPGLVGFAGNLDPGEAQRLIQEMVKAMKDHDWYQVDLYHGEGIGLGRASLGLMNPEPQPIWNEDKTLCIIMEGELYDYQPLKQELISKGHRFEVNNDAEFILHLFEEYDKDFAIHLNGAFVAAIWNRKTKELVLVNDHLGARPLYYTTCNGRFAFASGVRALLALPELSRVVDKVAIVQMLTFEYVLGNRTLLCEVNLLPAASILTFSGGRVTIDSYWRALRFDEVCQKYSEQDYVDGLIYHLRQAIARQLPGEISAGLNLSGGLDSRLILGLLTDEIPRESLKTFTFGIRGCDDARFARELASQAEVTNQFFELRPGFLIGIAEDAVRLTDGMESCIHVHALANLKTQAQSVDMLYTGYFIDSLIGPDGDRTWLTRMNEDSASKLVIEDLNRHYLFSPSDRAELLTLSFQDQIEDQFEESYRAIIDEAKTGSSVLDWQNNVDLLQRQRRFTGNGTELLRSRVIARTPFGDKDLAEYALSIPIGLRLERYVLIKAIAQVFPNLAKVPWDKTGYPLIGCRRDLLLRLDHLVRWRLRIAGFKSIPVEENHPYIDYNHWLRTDLRSWVENLLLNPHTLARGYFKPEFIRKLVSEHMAGANHAHRLGVLLSLEIWHKQYLD